MMLLIARNLRYRRLRAALTASGVAVGALCFVLLTAIGYTNYRLNVDQIAANQALTQIEIYGARGGDGLDSDALGRVRAVAHVEAATPVLEMPLAVRVGKFSARLTLKAVEAAFMDLVPERGEWLSGQGALPELVLGYDALRQFSRGGDGGLRDSPPPADWLNERTTIALSVYEEGVSARACRARVAGTMGQGQEGEAWGGYMDIERARQLIRENRDAARSLSLSADQYDSILVRVDEVGRVEEVLAELTRLHYACDSPVAWIRQVQGEQMRQLAHLIAIGAISVAVSALGIANTMYASVLERRPEIGVMKVVGMRRRVIRALFMLEAGLLGLTGGAAGALLSALIALAANWSGIQGAAVVLPWWLALAGVALSTGVGVAAGIYPAGRATRMTVMEAIRS